MSDKQAADVQHRHAPGTTDDARVARSTTALGQALRELLVQHQFRHITVQQILDRAGVARGTFYAHYRNKDDVLFTSYERMFAAFEARLEPPSTPGARLVPVTELLGHIGESRAVLESLRASDRLETIWELGVGFSADMIARRLTERPGTVPTMTAALAARMLAAAFMEMAKWWLDHSGHATPRDLDRQFHAMARHTLPAVGYRW